MPNKPNKVKRATPKKSGAKKAPLKTLKEAFKISNRMSFEVTDECLDNKFTFSFNRTNATITSLVVEKFHQDLPPDTGSFTVCVFDPNDPPQIRVTVVAKKDLPGGSASLSLKFLGKNVYDPARQLDDKGNGVLGFTELVNLPI